MPAAAQQAESYLREEMLAGSAGLVRSLFVVFNEVSGHFWLPRMLNSMIQTSSTVHLHSRKSVSLFCSVSSGQAKVEKENTREMNATYSALIFTFHGHRWLTAEMNTKLTLKIFSSFVNMYLPATLVARWGQNKLKVTSRELRRSKIAYWLRIYCQWKQGTRKLYVN